MADALELVGDRYSLLVLRELSLGVNRFNAIRQHIGVSRETLTSRLRKLEQGGVISRRRYSEHPPRDEYLLTEAGLALGPVLRLLRSWGAEFAPASKLQDAGARIVPFTGSRPVRQYG
jgi:DNA-binding HxlR family transcriptional regulator